jgi:hypothetical protein
LAPLQNWNVSRFIAEQVQYRAGKQGEDERGNKNPSSKLKKLGGQRQFVENIHPFKSKYTGGNHGSQSKQLFILASSTS